MAAGGNTPVLNAAGLTCIKCRGLMVSPAAVCDRGHILCKNCVPPQGRSRHGTRKRTVEKVVTLVKYKCRNHDLGCTTMLTRDLLIKHSETCQFKQVACPLGPIPSVRCQWSGPLTQVIDHVHKNHSDRIISRSCFNCYSLEDTHRLIIYKDEIFLYYKHIREGTWHAVVQRVGLTKSMFKAVFVFNSHDKQFNEGITFSFVVGLTTESLNNVFCSGRCLVLDEVVVRHYVKNKQVNMAVSIEHIENM